MAEVASVAPQTGATAAEGPIKDDCKELSEKNDGARYDLWQKTDDQSLMGKNVKVSENLSFENGSQSGTTVSSMMGSPIGGGASFLASAHNSQKAQEFFPSTFDAGGGEKVRSGEESTLCGNYTHPAPAEQKSGHAEARLFDSLGKNAAPTKLTLNIDWRPSNGKPSKMPCETCHQMMCAAKECKHQIFLCKKDGSPVEVSEKHCPVRKGSYQQLKIDMGE
jgi:hypothetical protein